MKKVDLINATKGFQKTLVKRQPELLVVLGIAGMVSAIVMSATAAVNASEEIKVERAARKKENGTDEWTKKDTIKIGIRHFAPTIVTATMSAACIIGSNRISARRNAALAAAYTLTENAFKDYKEKVIETIGAKKDKEIRDAVVSDQAHKASFKGSEVIITGHGETMCLDEISGQPFKSSIARIQKVENILNRKLRNENYVSLNDLYYELGIRQTPTGNELGWNVTRGDYIELEFGSTLVDDQPVVTMLYASKPKPNYEWFS